MALFRVLLYVFGLLGFLTLDAPKAYSSEPDFSYFEDSAGSKPTKKQKHKTEAQPPCITCGRDLPKSKNQSALERVSKRSNYKKSTAKAKSKKKSEKTSEKKSKKKSSQTEDCITCDRDKPGKDPVPSKSSSSKDWKKYPEVLNYSESNKVEKMISWVKQHKERGSLGMCYRYVKEALCGAKRTSCKPGSLVNSYLVGNPVFADRKSNVPKSRRAGKNAIVTLEKQGFVNMMTSPKYKHLIKNPASAPKGALMIYAGGNSGGHIEIKTDYGTRGTYISDFAAPKSIMGNELAGKANRRYTLLGVMIKPMKD